MKAKTAVTSAGTSTTAPMRNGASSRSSPVGYAGAPRPGPGLDVGRVHAHPRAAPNGRGRLQRDPGEQPPAVDVEGDVGLVPLVVDGHHGAAGHEVQANGRRARAGQPRPAQRPRPRPASSSRLRGAS